MSLNPFAGATRHRDTTSVSHYPERTAPRLALPYLVGTPDDPDDPWQERAVTETLQFSSCLAAWEQGTGKSILGAGIALWSRDNGFGRTLWVCPPVLVPTACRELARFTPDLTVAVLKGQTPGDLPDADVYVIGDSVVSHHTDAIVDSGLIRSVFVDEAHRHSRRSQRSESVRRITSTLPEGGPCVFGTGTPVQNHPGELCTLLVGLGRIDQWRHSSQGTSVTQWLDSFCPKVGSWGARGVSFDRLPEMHARLTGSPEEVEMPGNRHGETIKVKTSQTACMVRIRTLDVLDLDAAQLMAVPLSMDPRIERQYEQAQASLMAYLRDSCGYSPARLTRAARAEALVRLSVLRRLSSEGVVDTVVAYTKTLVDSTLPGEQPEKAVVFTTHRDAQRAIHAGLGKALATGARKATPDSPAAPPYTAEERCRHIWGSQSGASKQAAIDAFQDVDGPCVALVAAIQSASVGLTLTSGRHLVAAGLGWHRASMDQQVSRMLRHGQSRQVIGSIVMPVLQSGVESVVSRIWGLIEAKGDAASRCVDNEVSDDLLVGDDIADALIESFCSTR